MDTVMWRILWLEAAMVRWSLLAGLSPSVQSRPAVGLICN